MFRAEEALNIEQLRFIHEKRDRVFTAVHEIHLKIKASLDTELPDLAELRALISLQDEFIHEICADELRAEWETRSSAEEKISNRATK